MVVEAEAAGTATQAGRRTTQGHMGATEEVLGAAPRTKANKVGLEEQVAQHGEGAPHRGKGCEDGRGLTWADSLGKATVTAVSWLLCGAGTESRRRGIWGPMQAPI